MSENQRNLTHAVLASIEKLLIHRAANSPMWVALEAAKAELEKVLEEKTGEAK